MLRRQHLLLPQQSLTRRLHHRWGAPLLLALLLVEVRSVAPAAASEAGCLQGLEAASSCEHVQPERCLRSVGTDDLMDIRSPAALMQHGTTASARANMCTWKSRAIGLHSPHPAAV